MKIEFNMDKVFEVSEVLSSKHVPHLVSVMPYKYLDTTGEYREFKRRNRGRIIGGDEEGNITGKQAIDFCDTILEYAEFLGGKKHDDEY